MKSVPRRFQLLNHTIVVKIVPAADAGDAYGWWDPDTNEIVLARQPKSMMEHTFWHEAVHAILHMMSHPLVDDEVFVDQFGGLLAQLSQSAKYAAEKNAS